MIQLKGYKKALITGGAGFIGSHIAEELLKQGISVVTIDNYAAGIKKNLAHLHKYENFKEVDCDVLDMEGLRKEFDGVDIIFHNCASKKMVCDKDPRLDLDINAKGTFNMLTLAKEFNVKKFVHASTGSVYGKALMNPQDENHPVNPQSYYGVSKLAGEKYVKLFNYMFGLNTTVLRYFHVYGSRQLYHIGGVVPVFTKRLLDDLPPEIWGDGLQERSFTYVKDIVAANFAVANAKESKGEAYNVASGLKIKVIDLAEKINKVLGKDIKPIHKKAVVGEIREFNLDTSKLQALGWKIQTDFDQGLKETIEWVTSDYKPSASKKSL